MSRSLSASAFTKLVLSFFISFLLVACGGDKAPESFSFTPQVDLAPDTLVVSNTVTISGIDSEVSLSISGGEYSVDGADFTSAAGIILNDQTLQLRAQTPLGFSESKTVVITLNEAFEEFKIAEEFKLTTFAQDITPEEFVFDSVENSALNMWVTSDLVAITDINDAVDIIADNIEYSIDGNDFTSESAVITDGQSLRVRILSASSFDTASEGSINVGGLSIPFSVTTSGAPQIVSLDLVDGSEITVGQDLVANAVCIGCDESNTLYSWTVEGIEQAVSTEKHYRVTAETVLKEISVSATAVSLAGDEGEAVTRTYVKNRVISITGNEGAFSAVKYDGSVVAWGHSYFGGNNSSVHDDLANVKSIAASIYAFAAIRADGSVVTWGAATAGGDSSSVTDKLVDVQSIVATSRAFAAVKSDGSVVTWGGQEWGADSSAVSDELVNVVEIYSSYGAFAAIRADGSVVTWGHDTYGSDSNEVADELINVLSISSTNTAFAAVKSDGTVVTWGRSEWGGDSGSVLTQLVNVESITATTGAFAAIKTDGSVVIWGYPTYGGDSQLITDKLVNVKSVSATKYAFAAVKSDGTVVTWGNSDYGADSSSVADELIDVQSIAGTSTAFAAIRENGSVVTWGYASGAADSSSVTDQLVDVFSISAAGKAFAAMRSDGVVVVWGDLAYGGLIQDPSKLEPGGIITLK